MFSSNLQYYPICYVYVVFFDLHTQGSVFFFFFIFHFSHFVISKTMSNGAVGAQRGRHRRCLPAKILANPRSH
jgi:hypothetical protein